MSQLTLYLPDELIKRLKSGARRAKKSLSSYVSELLVARDRPAQWPDAFRSLYGSCGGSLPGIEDGPAEPGPDL